MIRLVQCADVCKAPSKRKTANVKGVVSPPQQRTLFGFASSAAMLVVGVTKAGMRLHTIMKQVIVMRYSWDLIVYGIIKVKHNLNLTLGHPNLFNLRR